MYIHLGNNIIISSKNIIAILNIEPPVSNDLQDVIDTAKEGKNYINISTVGKEKALVITDDNIYISPISSTTLYKRGLSYYKEV